MIGIEILLDLKKEYKHIKIIVLLPSWSVDLGLSPIQQERCKKIIDQCDKTIVMRGQYAPPNINIRKLWMIEHSSICIACWQGGQCYTKQTIDLAKEKGCKIRILRP